jgi:hypothetical protein
MLLINSYGITFKTKAKELKCDKKNVVYVIFKFKCRYILYLT